MANLPLDIGDDLPGIGLVPSAGSVPRCEVAREVFWFKFAPLLPPQPQQGSFIITHDDPGIRAADEVAPITRGHPKPVPGPVRETENADRRWVSLFCEINPICAGERRTQSASHRPLRRPAGVDFIDEKR
jgi:hypothetical protein